MPEQDPTYVPLFSAIGAENKGESDRMNFPAHVRAVGDAQRIAALSQLLRNRVLEADILEQHPPFFFRAQVSNTRLDTHFTFMMRSSLQNFAREAAAGVAFLPGHNTRHLPIGGSLTGELSEEGEQATLRADFYTLSGLQIGEVSTDGLIAGIKGGLTRDVSKGIHGGKWLCQICGLDYYRGRCPHLAGFSYEEEKDGVIRQMLCTVGVDDAHLSEVSAVFDGATPGAMIEKVYELARSGALSVDDVRQAENVYRLDAKVTQRMLALPALQKRHAGVDTRQSGQMPRKGATMGLEAFTSEELGRLREVFSRTGTAVSNDDMVACVEAMGVKLDEANKRVKELEPRAVEGDAYRNDLVAAALAEGVRAYGDKFNNESYERTLRSLPLDAIKQMRDDWKAVGDVRFAGGRSTTDGDSESAEPVRYVPDAAYNA